jgi:hypothetical protein
MKGKKGGGLPVAKMMGDNVKSAGSPATKLAYGNPNVVSEAKKKTMPAAQGTAAKPRGDRGGFKRGGAVKG